MMVALARLMSNQTTIGAAGNAVNQLGTLPLRFRSPYDFEAEGGGTGGAGMLAEAAAVLAFAAVEASVLAPGGGSVALETVVLLSGLELLPGTGGGGLEIQLYLLLSTGIPYLTPSENWLRRES